MSILTNSYYSEKEFETITFNNDLSFVFYIMFSYATNRPKIKIVFINGDKDLLNRASEICDYLDVRYEVKTEPTIEETHLIQNIGDQDFYQNLLKQIYK